MFRFADEPLPAAAPVRGRRAPRRAPPRRPRPTGPRLVGLVRRAGPPARRLPLDGEVELAGPGDTAAGVTVLSVGEDGVRVRRADGSERRSRFPERAEQRAAACGDPCYRPRTPRGEDRMALREKFGRLVLLEETDAGALGREYRAARLGPAGLDRLVTVLRFGPEVSSNAEATKRLMDEARLAARLQNPGLVRVLGIGRVEQSVYVSTELVEGRTVARDPRSLPRARASRSPPTTRS